MPYPIRLLLVDDHKMILESWILLFEKDKRFQVVGQCSSGAEAVTQSITLKPDVILMDINMSPMNGFEATSLIIERDPDARIIGVSANNNPRYAKKLFSLGAKGFVTKTSAFEELKIAIEAVHGGEEYLCRELRKND